MSLASDYAALQASAAAGLVTANVAVPTPFTGPNGRAEVTTTGGLRLVKTTSGDFEITSGAALAFAAWITATFA